MGPGAERPCAQLGWDEVGKGRGEQGEERSGAELGAVSGVRRSRARRD